MADLTFDVSDLIGVDFNPNTVRATIETNIPGGALVNPTLNKILLGNGQAEVATDGTGVFADLLETNATGLPLSGPFQYQVTIWFTPHPIGNAGRLVKQKWTSGWFSLTADADLADVVAEQSVPPEVVTAATESLQALVDQGQALVDQQQEIAGLTGEDAAVKALVQDSSSQTAAALSASFGAPAVEDEGTDLGAALAAKFPRRSEIPVNVSILDLPTTNCWTAHSGSKRSGLPIAPEQSMSAYRLAYALGAPILDIDYRQTRDGVLIGIHDADTSAVSDINVTVASVGYAYLPQIHHPLDVGTGWPAEDYSLLTDLLNEFGGKVVMTIEAKGGLPDVAPLAALIQERGLVDSVFINSGDSTVLAAIVAAGCHAHGFGAYTNAHLDAQAAAMGADIGMGLVEVPIDASAALVTYALGKGFGRIVAGPVNASGSPTSITKFSQLAAMDSRINGFVNDAVGYLGRPGGEASRSADSLAGPVRTGKRPPGMRIVNAPGGVWWTTSGAELRSLSPAGGRSLVAGSVSGTLGTSGSLTMKFKMPALPTSTSEAFRGRVLMPDEAPVNVAADASSQGYTISLRANGQLNLWSQPVGGGSGVAQGGTPTGPALVAGTEYGMRLDWTATQIRLVRTDAVATLSGAVTAGTATSLAVSALPATIATGTKLVLPDGTEVTTSASAAAGATSISITSATLPAMASGAGLLITTGWTNNTDWRGKYHGAYTSMTTGQAYLTDIAIA